VAPLEIVAKSTFVEPTPVPLSQRIMYPVTTDPPFELVLIAAHVS
jgi:hypothetical protein